MYLEQIFGKEGKNVAVVNAGVWGYSSYQGLHRFSEILDLQWRQLDLGRRTLSILEQKNQGTDTLPLNGTALEVLNARAKVRQIATGKSDYVFANQAGNRMDARDLLRAFYAARRRAQIAHVRFHDLRHTWATRLVQNGVDLYTVQRLGRWKTVSMVMRYAHHSPESLRAGAEVLDHLRSGISTKLAQSAENARSVPGQVVELFGAPGRT